MLGITRLSCQFFISSLQCKWNYLLPILIVSTSHDAVLLSACLQRSWSAFSQTSIMGTSCGVKEYRSETVSVSLCVAYGQNILDMRPSFMPSLSWKTMKPNWKKTIETTIMWHRVALLHYSVWPYSPYKLSCVTTLLLLLQKQILTGWFSCWGGILNQSHH